MKKIFMLFLLAIVLVVCSCNTNSKPDDSGSENTPETPTPNEATYINVHPVSYREVNKETDMNKFYRETKKSNGSSHDAPHEYGFVDSVWHKLTINDKQVKVYSARCGYGIHSFAWVDIETDGEFNLDVEIELLAGDYKSVVVLPEKEKVVATMDDNLVTATISNYGSFSFAFDDNPYMAMTLYVAPYSELEVPAGYEVVEITPGYYDNSEEASLDFTKKENPTNKVYYFKKGTYDITSISIQVIVLYILNVVFICECSKIEKETLARQ